MTVLAALENGITFIDTADAYCLDDSEYHHNERLIADIVHARREKVVIGTKCGVRRPAGAWTVDGRPTTVRATVHGSLAALGTEALDLLQLHSPDARVPLADTVGAMAALQQEGKALHLGLCNVSIEQLAAARKIAPIATVQNRWNIDDRRAEREGMLEYCDREGIAFLAYSPFGGARGAPALASHGHLAEEARRRRISPYRLLLAWMLAKSPTAIALVGARRPESIGDTAKAGFVELAEADVAAVEAALERSTDT
jgi:aryl-alcohol dehydrogenase-like predicted oxidoreductase